MVNLDPWDADGEKSVDIDNAILYMIAVDLQPLQIVENVGFGRLLNLLQPKYKIKSRKYFTNTLLPKIYAQMKVREELISL